MLFLSLNKTHVYPRVAAIFGVTLIILISRGFIPWYNARKNVIRNWANDNSTSSHYIFLLRGWKDVKVSNRNKRISGLILININMEYWKRVISSILIFDERGICSLPVTGFWSKHLGSKQPKINIQSTKIDNTLIFHEEKHMKFRIKAGKCGFFQ